MVKIKISRQAQKDMRQVYDFVSDTSLQSAEMLIEKFILKIDSLKEFPERGKIVKEFSDPSIREISVFKFLSFINYLPVMYESLPFTILPVY